MRRKITLSLMALGLLLLAGSSLFTVDWTEYVYVTQFGKPVMTFDGTSDAGLHFKWPWPLQTVQKLDRRIHVLDLPATELLTQDQKGKTIDRTLTISAYVSWRIADSSGVDRFIRAVGTPEKAEMILGQRINSQLGSEISNLRLDELINDARDGQVGECWDRLSRRLLGQPKSIETERPAGTSLKEIARDTYGIELVDIRLRRFNYPPQVREAIFDRIRSERSKKAAEYLSEGEQLAKNIQSEAELNAQNILTQAKAKEQRSKGQAEADADRIRNEAHIKDVAFYVFLKKLEEYQRILGDNKTVLLLSSHRELFDLLFRPPSPNGSPGVLPDSIAGPLPTKQPAKNGKQ
jgi:modulator of FtsH protease HflC